MHIAYLSPYQQMLVGVIIDTDFIEINDAIKVIQYKNDYYADFTNFRIGKVNDNSFKR